MYFWCGLIGHVCISGHVFLQLSLSSNHLTSILQDNSSWQTDMRTHPLKSNASGPLKIKKGTCPALILATPRHTTESAASDLIFGFWLPWTCPVKPWKIWLQCPGNHQFKFDYNLEEHYQGKTLQVSLPSGALSDHNLTSNSVVNWK